MKLIPSLLTRCPFFLNHIRVLLVKQGAKSISDIDHIEEANVIIATASSLALYDAQTLLMLTKKCSHLIIDEAHHVTARTWNRIKKQFLSRPIIQFTATPFRSDRSRVDGKIIFNYPIKAAQNDGYFKKIEFHPVREFVEDRADLSIAKKAISILRTDLKDKYDHILMARACTIARAKKIYEIYSEEKDLNPVLLNSESKDKTKILDSIKSGKHRIVVCVDMLGEGFDLPQLKIAALHDIHKSINITLQFTGRFTRLYSGLGNAKFIANTANPKVNETLEELYSEDSDWNKIIKEIGTKKVSEEKLYQEFRSDFDTVSSKLLDLGLYPKISTTIYKTNQKGWKPENHINFPDKNTTIVDSAINKGKNTLIFLVKSLISVGWSSSHEIRDVSWDLYVVFYDVDTGLLFVHSSSKDGKTKKLIKLIARNAGKISGEYCATIILAG